MCKWNLQENSENVEKCEGREKNSSMPASCCHFKVHSACYVCLPRLHTGAASTAPLLCRISESSFFGLTMFDMSVVQT